MKPEENAIDAWSNQAITDYDHVFKEFGLKPFPKTMATELNHYLFERGIIIAHRDFDKIFERIQKKKPFINITGIASSGPYHLGHKVDIDLFAFLKKKGAKNYFAVCDIDGYVSRSDAKVPSMKAAKEFAVQNTADALALGLDPEDIYVQSKKPSRYYEFSFEISKKITTSTFEAIYGHLDMGKISANLLQYADILHGQLPEFEGKMPSVTGIGLDQDPHARATRDFVERLPYEMEKPSFLYFKHQSGLKEGSKMSASEPDTAIFLNDPPKEIERKIQRAFTGGRPTLEEHRKLGGVLEIDKVFEMLWFHYPNTKELLAIADEFKSGKMLSREMKQIAIDYFVPMLLEHQKKAKENLAKAKKIVYG
ncbi:MAG: tryptophan--tRNA ligase [Candidatus Diapherotrites archaeon]|uniref:Tryptophan--tRNA ligase n=1 Tax=Candidatus Iainarchaeum sp. TaxID=3101447 RepID=A0A8T4LA69_9ARCH|nr:tryptophan--tRNA ligase [Candidatus Diapherotrites archaeon]